MEQALCVGEKIPCTSCVVRFKVVDVLKHLLLHITWIPTRLWAAALSALVHLVHLHKAYEYDYMLIHWWHTYIHTIMPEK